MPPTAPGVVQVTYGAPTWVLIVVGVVGFVLAVAMIFVVFSLRHRQH